MKSKELFPAIFSHHAVAYQRRLEDIMSRGESVGRARAVELADVRPGMKILDLACGPGNLSRRLASLVAPGGEVVGVDLAPGMIELALAANIPNSRFEVMDIEQLAFEDSYFDAAVCGHGFQFVPDLPRALSEARRVLHARGRLAASVPVGAANDSVMALMDSVVDRWLPPAPQPADRRLTGTTVQDAVALRQAALDAGFSSARMESITEDVHWESAEHLVSMFTGWWDCAARLEGLEPGRRQAFMDDAIDAVRRGHPGAIETISRNHVLVAEV